MGKTVAVIGAGIVGVATAISLQREGHDVILIDKAGPAEGTSYGNGGVLASCAMVPVTGPGLIAKAPLMAVDPKQSLFVRWGYLPKMLPWLFKYLAHANEADTLRISEAIMGLVGDSLADHQAISEGTGAEHYVIPTDYLYAYKDSTAFRRDRLAWEIRKSHGIKWEILENGSLSAYDPAFSQNMDLGVKMGNHGRISDPGAYVKALAAHVMAQGGRFIKAKVDAIVEDNGQVTGVRVGGETIACEACVVATGIWSGPLAKSLGVKVPMESERGYHVELSDPSIMPKVPTMVASGKFVMTPMDGRLRLAGVVEFGGLDAAPSNAPFAFLLKGAREALPGIKWTHKQEWMGHRPAPSDSIPVIGEAPRLKGAFLGFGHHHIGLTAGPKTGRILTQMISGKAPNQDVSIYSPSRFV
ncbi:MAG: FAD-binding oxidoreductase [Litoreibacter sp.]